MQYVQKVLIAVSCLAFLLVAIGLFTPGWTVIYIDVPEMEEQRLRINLAITQQHYKIAHHLRKRGHNFVSMKKVSFYIGLLYLRSCTDVTGFTETRVCLHLPSKDILSMFVKIYGTGMTTELTEEQLEVQNIGSNLTPRPISNIFIAINIVSSLVVIQAATSLIWTIIYTCNRYPRKRMGIAGGVSCIISGAVTGLLIGAYLIFYGYILDIIQENAGEAVSSGFPYSTIITCFGSVLFFVTGGLLIRWALTLKGQFSYKMIVTDTSRGGVNYIAKT